MNRYKSSSDPPQYRPQPGITMRSGITVLLALVAAVAAKPGTLQQRAADQDLLQKQQDTICLLENITGDLLNQQLYNLGVNYDILSNVQQYDEPAIVTYYAGMVQSGHIQPKGTVYSNSVSQLRKEVALLTRVLLSAQDYTVFLKTAAWARVNVNEGQFVKAYIAAILQHEDTQGVIPPALYEIIPQYYLDSRVIQEAQNIYTKGLENLQGEQTVVIPVNHTDYLPHGEHQLHYFTQDIGLQVYNAYITLAGYMIPEQQQQVLGTYQQGYGSEKGQTIGQGSLYYYLHQQLLAHYNLERLSNGLGPILEVDLENVHAPFQPHLRHINGLELPGRPEELTLTSDKLELIKNVNVLEKRLLNAIDSGYVITPQQQFLSLYQPQGLNILGELIEGTGKSVNPRYYGSLQAVAQQLLGNTPEFDNIWSYTPSALELAETSVRDPAFYQLFKRVINLFHRYQQSLPAYQYNDLVLPGVKIEQVNFPNLVTYFDQYLVDLENSIVQPVNQAEQGNLHVKAQVQRLNHKQYQYQIIVQSEKPITNAVVRVYLGPKYDYNGQPIDINQNRLDFVELDQFVHSLQEGKNVIVRDSQQAPIHSADYPTVQKIKTHVDSAVRSQNPYYITEPQQIFGFPARLSIPKGRYGGLPLQVLVVISSPVEQNIAYGPVIPNEFATYQQNQFQIVNGEQYQQHVQQGQQQQQGIQQQGVQPIVEVLPHYQSTGVYGNQINKLQAYYGSYLYKKYPSLYPYAHSQYYQGQGLGHQQYGIYHGMNVQGVNVHHGQQQQQQQQQQPLGQYGVGQGIYQGQIHQGQQYQQVQSGQQGTLETIGTQGVYQGVQGVQGISGVYPSGVYGGVGVQGVQGQGIHGIHGVQGVQGIHGVQGVEGLQGVQGVQGVQGIHGIQGVQGVQGIQGVHGGQGIQGGIYGTQTVQDEILNQYYKNKHISHIIGGAISLDNKPLGYPLDRPLAPSACYVPNIHVTDVIVHHQDTPIVGVY